MLELLTIGPRTPWSIFDELESLQADMNRLLTETEPERYSRRTRRTYPPMNVWASPEGLVVDAEMPGVDPKEVDISVVGDEVTLHGKVNTQDAAQGEVVLRRERPSGEFQRTLQLPFRADAAGVKATSKNGILRIAIPRSEAEKPRKITIETA